MRSHPARPPFPVSGSPSSDVAVSQSTYRFPHHLGFLAPVWDVPAASQFSFFARFGTVPGILREFIRRVTRSRAILTASLSFSCLQARSRTRNHRAILSIGNSCPRSARRLAGDARHRGRGLEAETGISEGGVWMIRRRDLGVVPEDVRPNSPRRWGMSRRDRTELRTNIRPGWNSGDGGWRAVGGWGRAGRCGQAPAQSLGPGASTFGRRPGHRPTAFEPARTSPG